MGVNRPSELVSHRAEFHMTPELERKIKENMVKLIREEDPDQVYNENTDNSAREAVTGNRPSQEDNQEHKRVHRPAQTPNDDDLQFLGFIENSEVRVVDVIIPGITSPPKMSDRKRKRETETRQNNRIAEALRRSRDQAAVLPLLALGSRRDDNDRSIQIIHRGRPGVASQLVINDE